MLVSYKWLKELVDVDVTTAELAEKMSTTGIEVEGVETPAEGLSKLVVGHVLSCEDVPETHLHLCQVDTGDAEGPRQIVCELQMSLLESRYCCYSWCTHCGQLQN
ncbi:MAG: hypothetical protein ACLS36_06165 [Streptococcus sp.]